jgi:hypothetical protein
MVYINSWQEYQEAAENLYANSPRKVRYTLSAPSSQKQNETIFLAGLTDPGKDSVQRKMEIFGG